MLINNIHIANIILINILNMRIFVLYKIFNDSMKITFDILTIARIFVVYIVNDSIFLYFNDMIYFKYCYR